MYPILECEGSYPKKRNPEKWGSKIPKKILQVYPKNIELWVDETIPRWPNDSKKITLNYFLRVIPTLKHYSGIVSFIPSGSIWKYLRHIDSGFLSGIYFDILSGIRFRSCHYGITGETYRIISGTKNAPVTIERPKSAEIEVKLIGKCGSPAKLPKTEPASTILQWLDACDPLPTIWHLFWHTFWRMFWHSCWHSIWHLFWHTFRHSFWHSIWYSFWHSIRQSLWRSIWHIILSGTLSGMCWGPGVPSCIRSLG